jgi:transposase
MPAPLPVELRERIVRAYFEHDLTKAEVAELFNVGEATVTRLLARNRRGSLEPDPLPGGRPKILPMHEEWLRAQLEADPYLTSYELADRYNRRFSAEPVHRSSILRAMHRLGFTHKKRPR